MNQIVPAASITSVCGLPPEGALCSITLPVAGSSSPITPLPLPVYQTRPPGSTSSPWGCVPSGRFHSLNLCVLVSKRAILSANITVM